MRANKVVARVCTYDEVGTRWDRRGKGFSSPSRERLKKTGNRLDHLVSREQLVVVVIGVGKDKERLRSLRGLIQTPTVVDRHDSIVPTNDDKQWHSYSPNVIDCREPIAEKKAHR